MKISRSIISAALVVAMSVAGAMSVHADDAAANGPLTYTKDIMPIMQENCQVCHRTQGTNLSGMIAPMAFTSYAEVRPWAKSIARVVETREMPPWHATQASHGTFKNERTLTDAEIDMIIRWVGTGARKGKDADAPAPIEYTSHDGWSIGVPDLVLTFEEPFFVGDDIADHYENINVTLTEEQLPEDRYIKALEFRSGSDVVHHIIANAYAPGAGGERSRRGMIGGMAPGTDAPVFPDGYGYLLKKGSTITFAMHYHKEKGPGTGTWDRSEMALIFHDGPVDHQLHIEPISNGRFEIPPMAENWRVGMSRTFPEDTTIMSLMPHTHLRGKAASYTAYYPDGTSEELLEVPNYDFNWQTEYTFAEPKKIPAGTRIEASLTYDNSPTRAAYVPEVDPTRSVRFGGPTTDEMDLAWMTFAATAPITQK